MPKEMAPDYIAQFLLMHEIQVSDPELIHFVSVTSLGLATSDA